ncbi:MAG: winged helix-turn-helix transcriptional regulator [Candidatus Thorarchaeota archaeon]
MTSDLSIDRKDLAIVSALDEIGGKASAKKLGETLGIPSRTVRYRLSRLRRTGILHPPRAMTHARKLGLGENFVAIETSRKGTRLLRDVLESIEPFYSHSESYGKYNGYIAQSVYPLTSPSTTNTLLRAMQGVDLVDDFHVFDIVDYEYKRANYDYFSTDSGWTWDWKEWYDQIEKNLNSAESLQSRMEQNTGIVEFDSNDVLLLKQIMEDSETTQKRLSDILGLSETLVNKRIHRLENTGIIKGYRSVFTPYGNHGMIVLVLELEESVEQVLRSFYLLPFQLYVMMESKTRYCIRFSLSSKDHKMFLRGFDLIRPHVVSYFFQTLHSSHPTKPPIPFDRFDQATGKWAIPVEESLQIIRDAVS